MIESLLIKNFQSHKKTLLEFDKGINVIYGLSQAGKTAILRAFRLLVYNRPSGARFYSNFAPMEGTSQVQVQFDNARVTIIKDVRKSKDGKKILKGTIYGLDRGKDHLDWSPGTDIPGDIRNALNMGEMNIQSQFDAPFLIMSPPGEVARTINKITKLEQVDKWKAELTRRINQKNQEIKIVNDQAKEIQKSLENYQGFEDLDEEIIDLKKVDNLLDLLYMKGQSLDQSIQKIEEAEESVDKIAPILKELERLESEALRVDGDLKRMQDKHGMLSHIDFLDRSLQDMEGLLEMLLLLKYAMEKESYRDRLANTIDEVEFIQKGIDKDRSEINDLKSEYMKKLKQDKICPVCFHSIDQATIKRIEKGLE